MGGPYAGPARALLAGTVLTMAGRLAAVDPFIRSLFEIHQDVQREGLAHEFSLGLFRSDYMLHQPAAGAAAELRQVEFNTIAASFGGLASRVSELHRYLLRAGAYPAHRLLAAAAVPPNPAADELAAGLSVAHHAYGAPAGGRTKAVLFVVQPGERNAFDQRWLEYALLERAEPGGGIRTYRLALADVLASTALEAASRRLLLTTPHGETAEISVVYFRAGYGPADYPTAAEWAARRQLERSRAIKCPTIATQLAGAKKVQQELAVPGTLERFVPGAADAAALRATFAALYPLDAGSAAGREARRLAFEAPKRHVLKPQREGGGNNVYGAQIPGFLRGLADELWRGYILMQLIEPPPARAVVVRYGHAELGPVVGELGVYGVALWRADGELVVNRDAGWLLRTKAADSEEGGVAAGFGCIDGVCLV